MSWRPVMPVPPRLRHQPAYRRAVVLAVAGYSVNVASLHYGTGAVRIVASVFGGLLILSAFVAYLRAIGRHPAWCLLAFAGPIGIVIVLTLQHRSTGGQET